MTRFRTLYGKHPLHLVGHIAVIAVTAYLLSIMFQARFAPQPLNLALWLLGGAVLHDAVFLPIYGVVNTLLSRGVGAGDGTPLKDLAMGPAESAVDTETVAAGADDDVAANLVSASRPSRDAERAVPVINHIRTPLVISGVLFVVFLPRILERQPQNFVNALGHEPPDFLARWFFVTGLLVAASALLYAVRRLRA